MIKEVRVSNRNVAYTQYRNEQSVPGPVIFVFSGSRYESIHQIGFRQCGELLAQEGWCLVSLDLPFHGDRQISGCREGLFGWAECVAFGANLFREFLEDCRVVVRHLIESKVAAPGRIYTLGTSRGAYAAAQFAASDPCVRGMALFSPVTRLERLAEFEGLSDRARLEEYRLNSLACALAGRPTWIGIGDRDKRVGTDAAIDLAKDLTRVSLELTGDSAVELHVVPERMGHTTPAGLVALAADWLRRLDLYYVGINSET
jgi:pimeloyl-ACP methyl ester carboxylesterase